MSARIEASPPRNWVRDYPPMAIAAVAALIAIFVLPSSLNLPQSNPSTVLEYAPVPPEDEDPPPPSEGNASALGLGSSNSLGEGVPSPPPPPPPGEGDEKTVRDKSCVGDRQTEDPMSPPCVPYFEGENFGATYQGVSGREIKVLIYLDNGCPKRECSKAPGEIQDLDEPAKPRCPETWPSNNPNRGACDYIWVRTARAFNRYFNERFQTYNRHVHYYAFVSSASSAATRRKDAADLWATLKPFAVIDYATYGGFNEHFANSMAARGVLTFTSRSMLTNAFYEQNAPLAWGFYPDVEHWAAMYTDYVCKKIAPHPVRFAGNPQGSDASVGQPRRLGLFYTTDKGEPGLHRFRELVKRGLKDCGADWVEEATFPHSGFVVKGSDAGVAQQEAVTKFQQAGVTTILYLGGIEGRFSHIADGQKYYPEIVFAGDLENDNNQTARLQNQNVWRNAWGTQLHTRLDHPTETTGYNAYQSAYPEATEDEAPFANEQYRDHFMLFQAIQVAGPRLNPGTVDEGFHAIPEHRSTSPYVASCFFDRGDYSCTKDAMEVWWDPGGDSPGAAEPGCHRMVDGGTRYLAGDWPRQASAVFGDPGAQPCTGFESRYQIDPS